jgi:DNA-binding transcriptional LysR family regulator
MSVALSDLELLLDVAELGSFSQAAAKRGWSQPQVSQRIGLLEQHWGVSLFTRHRRGRWRPTPVRPFWMRPVSR